MYEFHYDYIKNKHDNKSKLLLTDTVSLMYEIKTEDVYEDFSSDKEMFDFSNYSNKSKCYDNSNKVAINERWNRRCYDWRICWIEDKNLVYSKNSDDGLTLA